MPRQARLDAPGVCHHIIIRGIERRRIFRNEKDREDFLDRLEVLLGRTCFWAVRELGIPMSLAKKLGLSGPGVGYAVERGEMIAREYGYSL
jgi:hypothetical protein